MSETAPEQPASSPARPPSSSSSSPPGRENVFTRKLGPLPMWVWLAIAAAVLLVIVFMMKKKGTSSSSSTASKQQGTRYGSYLIPEVIRTRGRSHPPHAHHKHKRHHKDPDPDPDPGGHREATALNAARQAAARDPGAGVHHVPGHNRRHMRGEPVPGELVGFKTAEQGETPSLQDVANHYDTAPEAIVQEAEGRGYPNSMAWKRYVAQHDWASPLPPATDFSILAHPSG